MRRISIRLVVVVMQAMAWLGWAGSAAAWRPELELEHEGRAWCVAFSPDGKTIATAGSDAVFRLWDAESGKLLGTIDALPGPAAFNRVASSLAFTPDGKTLLASVSYSKGKAEGWAEEKDLAGGVQVWDLESKKLRYTIEAIFPPLMALSPDGKTVAIGPRRHNDCEVSLWDVETGKKAGVLPYRKELPTVMEFSPDGKRLAVGVQDGTVELWDPAAKKLLTTIEAAAWGLAFSPDGKTLAVSNGSKGSESALQLFDVKDLDNVMLRDKSRSGCNYGWSNCLRYSPDGKTLAIAQDYYIGRLSPSSGAPLGIRSVILDGNITCFAFSPDSKRVAVAVGGKKVTVWRLTDD